MILPKDIFITEFNYSLPKEKIASYPLAQRDQSKVLIYKNKQINETIFYNIHQYISSESIVIFNKTKVIKARILFQKGTGAQIEIFCLEPADQTDFQIAYSQTSGCLWKCFVGNASKWKTEKLKKQFIIKDKECIVFAERIKTIGNEIIIRFTWTPENISFSEILEYIGLVPLPPYIPRNAEESDKERYQTIFAAVDGSVAAPTAGLHFTEQLLEKLTEQRIEFEHITLHVGAGTFKPVTTDKISDHQMHAEHVFIEKKTIQKIFERINRKSIVAIGTTTLRTLESLYWFGVKLLTTDREDPSFEIKQWDAYQTDQQIDVKDSLDAVLKYMNINKINELSGNTQLMIVPGYTFKIVNVLITNFHQPQSTLLLLVAAFIGNDWKKVYDYALAKDYRFLSYGDSCLFFRQD